MKSERQTETKAKQKLLFAIDLIKIIFFYFMRK